MPVALSQTDASIVKGMLLRGDKQHDIAAWFGCNPGRVADVKTGKKHADVVPAPAHVLPRPGPASYFTERPDMSVEDTVRQVLAAFDLKWSRELTVIAHERRQTNEKIDLLTRLLGDLRRDLKLLDGTAPKPSRRHPRAG